MVRTHCLTLPSFLTGIKLGNVCSIKLASMQSGKIAHAVIRIIKLVINYFLEKMASSTNRKVSLKVMLGLSHQSIQMKQSRFDIEQNQNTLTLGEPHLFSTIKLNEVIKVIFCVMLVSHTTIPQQETFQFITLIT